MTTVFHHSHVSSLTCVSSLMCCSVSSDNREHVLFIDLDHRCRLQRRTRVFKHTKSFVFTYTFDLVKTLNADTYTFDRVKTLNADPYTFDRVKPLNVDTYTFDRVKTLNEDKTVAVDYDDGDFDNAVPVSHLKRIGVCVCVCVCLCVFVCV